MASQFGPKREMLMGGKQGAGPSSAKKVTPAYKNGGKVAPPKGGKMPFGGKKGC